MGIGKRRADAHVVMRAGLAAALALLALLAVRTAGDRPAWAAAEKPSADRPVLFVPLGGFPRSDAKALARYVRAKVGARTGVLGSASIPRSAFDAKRKQYVAQRLIARVGRPASEPQAVMIGLTVEDMYSRGEPWRFVFSLRSPQGFAVVSRTRIHGSSV